MGWSTPSMMLLTFHFKNAIEVRDRRAGKLEGASRTA
jgi:hypothetical protein